MNKYIQYLHETTITQPYALPTAIAPVLSVMQRPVYCAIQLPDKIIYRDGIVTLRPQFSHAVYEYAGQDGDWLLVRNMHGILRRRAADVRFANTKTGNEVKKAA